MARYHRVVWNEGMFLRPHHFQQWDSYHENLLNFGLESVSPFYWGLTDLEINQEGVENGTFMLLSCRGILPEGLAIDSPEIDEAPASRAVEEHFDPSQKTLDVYLAVPIERPGSANCRLDDDNGLRETRYFRDFVQVVDANTGDNAQEISVAKKNLKILFSGESRDDHNCLKIAELERTPSGTIALREDYIPPCLSISASTRIMQMLRRLMELLIAKSNAFREQCRHMENDLQEFSAGDMLNLWRLQTINSFIPELNHFYRTGRGHPETLYRLLARIAGTLTTFSEDTSPTDFPEYDHNDLSRSFGALDTFIQERLQVLVPIIPAPPPAPTPTKYKLIRLKEVRESIYEYAIEDYLLDPSYEFYVAFKGEGDGRELIEEILRRVKVASADDIDFLIGKALRGIHLKYSPSPPTDIPVKSGYCYFALDAQGDYWEGVQQSKSLAIYIPASFEGIELELIALESDA